MTPIIVLMTNALRLDDHPALAAACDSGRPVVPVFILDEVSTGARPLGGARRWWLMQSLISLSQNLKARGSRLTLRKGDTESEVAALVRETGATSVYMTRGYTPHERSIEARLHDRAEALSAECRRFAGNLLLEPEMIRNKTGHPYEVFTPFWRRALELIDTAAPLEAPDRIKAPDRWPTPAPPESLKLAPNPACWADSIAASWKPGEKEGRRMLASFLDEVVSTYKDMRDFPGIEGTSRLSPYLANGEISPRRIWFAAMCHVEANSGDRQGLDWFLRELGWREFSRHLLFHNPALPDKPLKARFRAFPWREGVTDEVKAWQRGLTGFPIIDAGMRQLWQTGWMHNRVRMIVASFLVKDMLWHWREGEAWFWDTLVDADMANNAASWQWVAGCGADAAPYFRIFNPVAQGEKFDPQGSYIRTFVPELKNVPDAYIHKPFEAPGGVLAVAGVTLGKAYPKPMLDRKAARERALAALATIKVQA